MDFITIPGRLQRINYNLKKHRKIKGYSQLYVASKLNVSQNAYSKLEMGVSRMTINNLFQIADIFDLNVNDLLN